MEKKCFKCGLILPINSFYKHPQMNDGHVNKCKECNKKDVRENYIVTASEKRKYDSYRYRYSINRIFNHRYSCLKTRSSRVLKNHSYSCFGKGYLTKEDWNNWCYRDDIMKKFMNIYNNWVQNNFDEKLAPSIDRINNNLGYSLDNLQWLTKSENSSKYTK